MYSLTGITLLWICFVRFADASCLDGWLKHGGTCYHFSSTQMDWSGAKVMCEAMTGQLVEIDTTDENYYLGQHVKSTGRSYWIALTDITEEGIWMWMNSHTKPSFYTWEPNEPNNGGNENCVDMHPNGLWNDAPCHVIHYFICEKPDETEIVGK
ncbi:CD209 antigen-like protein [Mactra antiquata]